MTRHWWTIAKVELLVRTAKIKRIRKIGSVLVLALFLAWALLIVPQVMTFLLEQFSFEFNLIIQTAYSLDYCRICCTFSWSFTSSKVRECVKLGLSPFTSIHVWLGSGLMLLGHLFQNDGLILSYQF